MKSGQQEQGDPFALGREAFDHWGAFMRQMMGAGTPQWGAPLDAFREALGDPVGDAGQAFAAMAEHGRQFLQFMQAVAARMGSGDAMDAKGLSELWRQALGQEHPFLQAARALGAEPALGARPPGAEWAWLLAAIGPLAGAAGLDGPALGPARERQQHFRAWQRAARAHAEAQAAFSSLLSKAGARGMEVFERKLAERSEPGRQLDSIRAVYDLWVDAAEEAWAEVAMSAEFRRAYGELTNTGMRLREAWQREVEYQTRQLGIPTRSEVDGSHRKLQEMQRELRRLRARIEALEATATAALEPAVAPAGRAGNRKGARAAGASREKARPARADDAARVRESGAGSTKRRSAGKKKQGA